MASQGEVVGQVQSWLRDPVDGIPRGRSDGMCWALRIGSWCQSCPRALAYSMAMMTASDEAPYSAIRSWSYPSDPQRSYGEATPTPPSPGRGHTIPAPAARTIAQSRTRFLPETGPWTGAEGFGIQRCQRRPRSRRTLPQRSRVLGTGSWFDAEVQPARPQWKSGAHGWTWQSHREQPGPAGYRVGRSEPFRTDAASQAGSIISLCGSTGSQRKLGIRSCRGDGARLFGFWLLR